jgi:hypothetical protein
VTVRNNYNATVSGATVVVKVDYRRSSTWYSSPNLTATTNASGVATFNSILYNSSGSSRADEIRFQVQSVTSPGLTWQVNTTTVSALRPN